MQLKRRIRWGEMLKAAGLIALGYFIGRPDQIQQLTHLKDRWVGRRYVVSATVQHPTPQTTALPPQAQAWNQFVSADGKFSVMMPSKPTESADENGKHFSIEIGDENYSVSYNDRVPNIHLLTTEGKQVLLNQMPGRLKIDNLTVVSQRSFGLDGNPGVEVHLRHSSPQLPNGIMRYIIAGNRMYALGVASHDPQKTQLFLNSFHLH
jgi:hypothetical protein